MPMFYYYEWMDDPKLTIHLVKWLMPSHSICSGNEDGILGNEMNYSKVMVVAYS